MRKDIVSSLAAKVGSAFFNFAVLIMTSRVLGVELRGDFAYTISIALAVAAFISISLENGYVSIINNVNNKLEMQNAFVSSLVILSAFCFSFLIVIQYFFSLNLSHNIYLIALIGSATLISKCFIGVFLVDGDLYIYNIALFFTRFLYLILSAILIYLGFEVEGVLYSFLLVQVLLIIIVIKQKKLTFNLNNCKQSVSQLFIHSSKVHASTLGTMLILQVPLILVGLISTKSNVALFDSALQVISILVLVVSSLTPVVYSYTANMSFDGSYKRTINLIKWSYCISSGFVLLFFIYSEELIGFLFGASFMGASPILKVLLIMFWFNVINYFVTPVWVMNNHALRLSVVNIFFGIVNTVGAYFFLRYSDIIKISWLMAFSSLLMFLCHVYYLKVGCNQKGKLNG